MNAVDKLIEALKAGQNDEALYEAISRMSRDELEAVVYSMVKMLYEIREGK